MVECSTPKEVWSHNFADIFVFRVFIAHIMVSLMGEQQGAYSQAMHKVSGTIHCGV